jgi:uncharacterized membrane protein
LPEAGLRDRLALIAASVSRTPKKEKPMEYILAAVLIGFVAGLRAMTAPAAVSWAAHLGWIDLSSSWLAFLGYAWTPYVFTALALIEFVTDQLPSTPSRKVPPQFGARIVMGGLSGAALGVAGGSLIVGLIAGIVGAVAGTLGGAAARAKLAAAFGRDLPAALVEDLVAIALAAVAVGLL